MGLALVLAVHGCNTDDNGTQTTAVGTTIPASDSEGADSGSGPDPSTTAGPTSTSASAGPTTSVDGSGTGPSPTSDDGPVDDATGGDTPSPSSLPIPPGPGDLPQPSGTEANLQVLPWAGFKSALTYTFDDAQPSHIQHYAELQAAGVPLTFYVSSGTAGAGNYDSTFAQAVVDGHEIGNHTAHHCQANGSGCAFGGWVGSAAAEVEECTEYAVNHFGVEDMWTSASPFGDNGWNSTFQQVFFLNRGVGNGTVAPNDNSDPFNLPCHLVTTNESVSSFNGAIDSSHSGGRWLIFLVHSISPTSDNWYNPVAVATITDSITYAQSLSDVWIDTMLAVGAYWRAQKVLSGVSPTASGEQLTWTWTLPDHFPPERHLRVTVDGGTLTQNGVALPWDGHGYYEVALDVESLIWTP